MSRILLVFVTLISSVLIDATLALGAPLEKPNILWLSTEDIGPQLACYGDATAKTPNLDALAADGLVYDMAWSNYPVCAPARTTIITGMYAACNGAGNMRSICKLPPGVKMFPQLMKEAGYYCTNTSKEDYNYAKPDGVWDQSSKKASWQNRAAGQPFFAVVNHTGTHESKIRNRPHKAIIDPAVVPVAPYWPDIPEVRQDLGQYYDNLMRMDDWIGKELQALKDAGESDNTIVVFFGDHGSGMPRHKRYAGDSGMRVPFVVYVPEKLRFEFAPKGYRPGSRTMRPVGFVDLAPSMLSIAGVAAPAYMQGRAVMGPLQAEDDAIESKYLFGFRDRMDERPDFSRSVRDDRYLYVRNYMPHLPAGQLLDYQQQTPSTRRWYEMYNAGELNEVQSQFWQPRSAEELYDLKADPHETKNLAGSPEHQEKLNRFRDVLNANTLKVRDLGFVHEGRLQEVTFKSEMTRRDLALDEKAFSLNEILEVANAVGGSETETFVTAAGDANPTVRYWAAIGLLNGGKVAVDQQEGLLKKLLSDSAPEVSLTAAESLIKFSSDAKAIADAKTVIVKYCDQTNSNHYYALTALNIVDRHRDAFKAEMPGILEMPTEATKVKRGGGYVKRMMLKLQQP
jgi:uncharacterized sulfatase